MVNERIKIAGIFRFFVTQCVLSTFTDNLDENLNHVSGPQDSYAFSRCLALGTRTYALKLPVIVRAVLSRTEYA